jgi:hypothetical protein
MISLLYSRKSDRYQQKRIKWKTTRDLWPINMPPRFKKTFQSPDYDETIPVEMRREIIYSKN